MLYNCHHTELSLDGEFQLLSHLPTLILLQQFTLWVHCQHTCHLMCHLLVLWVACDWTVEYLPMYEGAIYHAAKKSVKGTDLTEFWEIICAYWCTLINQHHFKFWNGIKIIKIGPLVFQIVSFKKRISIQEEFNAFILFQCTSYFGTFSCL
jgi:hypothetical protein